MLQRRFFVDLEQDLFNGVRQSRNSAIPAIPENLGELVGSLGFFSHGSHIDGSGNTLALYFVRIGLMTSARYASTESRATYLAYRQSADPCATAIP